MVDIVRKIEWHTHNRSFSLAVRLGRAIQNIQLELEDGQTLELTRDELSDLRKGIDEMLRLLPDERCGRAPNAGAPWSIDLDKQLTTLWRSGESCAKIAQYLGRSSRSIAARLVRIGEISDRYIAELPSYRRTPVVGSTKPESGHEHI